MAKTLAKKRSLLTTLNKYKFYYFLILPGILFFLIFHYIPMAGIVVAFKNISPFEGISGIFTSEWVGFTHFKNFFSSFYFKNVLINTIVISFLKILFGFPAPILLALLFNEVKNKYFIKFAQTVSYLPHFISMVIMAGIVTNVLSTNGGIVNEVVKFFGGEPIFFLGSPQYFRSILVISDIWQGVGWGSIIYLAAITGIDTSLYEAAAMDGAGKFRQILNVTIPGIAPTIIIMFILRVGSILNAGFEQVLLLYSPAVYKVGDIIDTFVYREGLVNLNYSYASAVGLFKSVIGSIMVIIANKFANNFGYDGIW